MFDIADNPELPFYRRIADAINNAILAGQVLPGEKLPARAGLAKTLNTSAITVGRAYELLSGQGVIIQKRGSGTFVGDDALDRLRHTAGRAFDDITVVIGKHDLLEHLRVSREILLELLVGLDDGFGDRVGRYRFVESFNRPCLESLSDRSAVLVWQSREADPTMVSELAQRKIPVLKVWQHNVPLPLPTVHYDPHQAASLAVQHLIDCGYRRLGFIGELGRHAMVGAKFFEFTNTLQRAGLDFETHHVCDAVEQQPGTAYQAAIEIVRTNPPDAIFVDSDWKALEVLTAIKDVGLRVPGDIGVVAYDDIVESSLCTPALTTVHTPRREIGQSAARLLLQWADTGTPLESVTLEAKLVVRETTTIAGERAVATKSPVTEIS